MNKNLKAETHPFLNSFTHPIVIGKAIEDIEGMLRSV